VTTLDSGARGAVASRSWTIPNASNPVPLSVSSAFTADLRPSTRFGKDRSFTGEGGKLVYGKTCPGTANSISRSHGMCQETCADAPCARHNCRGPARETRSPLALVTTVSAWRRLPAALSVVVGSLSEVVLPTITRWTESTTWVGVRVSDR
jgi:hypothetical protein